MQEKRAHSSLEKLAVQNAAAQGDSTGGTKIGNKSNNQSTVSNGPQILGIVAQQ
jgi:hypothetical protein